MILSNKRKEALKVFVSYYCEECNKKKESKELQIHRIHRGYLNGEYTLRNVKVICIDCHKKFHYGEFK